MQLRLPRADRTLENYRLSGRDPLPAAPGPPAASRKGIAAVHVTIDSLTCATPADAVIDYDATLAYRRYLWSLGLGVAEAMDTAQRGMGLDWNNARALIRRSCAEARACGGAIACGAIPTNWTRAGHTRSNRSDTPMQNSAELAVPSK